jgi:hypothetical protein
MEKYECGKIYDLAVSKLEVNPDQPRKAYSEENLKL